MDAKRRGEIRREVRRHIARAKRHEIDLTPSDFQLIDGDVCLDGMNPSEWIDAMVMD